MLVNNAGIFTQSLLEDLPVADWDRVLAVNLRGTFLCTRSWSGRCWSAAGAGSSTSPSSWGRSGGAEVAHYCASKGASSPSRRRSRARSPGAGVLVNAIAPGPIGTPLLDGETEAVAQRKLAELPIGRFGEVSEVVPTAVLLASEDGSYYVGQTLGPNGGDVML